MNPVKALLAATVLPMVYACSHPIVIHGEGDVLSESGNRDCTLADYQAGAINCTDNEVTTTYEEVYTGEPKSGWQFRRWGNYCGSALNNECAFFVPGDIVRNFWNATMPPLQAVFRSTTNDGFTAVFMGDSAFEVFATGIDFHAGNASFPEHNATVFVATKNDGSPGAFWNDPVDQASIQTVLDAGDVELLGMTYIEGASSLGDYQNWVEYALQQNLDTRFFISAPWADNPSSMTASEFAADYAQRQQNVHALIDALRDEYPGVDFYTVTTGAAAVELFNLFETGGLADVSALVGSSADALFSDNQGSPGNLLSALGELVWLGAVYDVDLTTYSHSPGFVTDLKSLAQQILNAQDPVYDAPPEVDSDTDGDGIVDRLDPNPEGRPNVLLIMVDDLGYNDLAINNGNSNIDTPNMDQLAQEGVRFTRHYATTVCSPARAAALTGLFPSRLGIAPGARAIPSEIETMPERLQQEGYTTWHIGKWHLGQYQRSAWPDRQGFDHWFGFLNPFHLAGSKVDGELVPAPLTYDNPYLEGSEQAGQFYNGHLEDVLTNRARNVLTSLNNAGAPWFLNLWFFAPHGPITPSSAFAQLYPDTDAGRYRALVNQLDFNVGQILDHLDALGALDNTFVILVSDNGGTTNQVDSNFPFFGVKATATEGALRTPLLMRFPEGAFNGRVIGDIVSIQDLYPTILDVIGAAPASGLDGQSLYTAISQQQAPSPTPLFWEHGLKSYGALSADGQWRLYQPPPLFGLHRSSESQYKYTYPHSSDFCDRHCCTFSLYT
ncbi:MAG: sulfatase-like hydrolase/transferase [Pseudomonadota bacterium]